MSVSAKFLLKNTPTETDFVLRRNSDGELELSSGSGIIVSIIYDALVPKVNTDIFADARFVESVLPDMIAELVEEEASGIESSNDNSDKTEEPDFFGNYSPRDIYVENKPFSVKQLILLVDDGDLELDSDFQRHFVWDRRRQSLLIESMLLGLPLPSIYLSQYDDGRLAVVDGLQRINTINQFVKNELRLTELEYLKEYNDKNFDELKNGYLSQLQQRQFYQIQIGCFVIDYRSPDRLKFDLFRRLNTGGKPLNRAEIRNCLTRKEVKDKLREMWESPEFYEATDRSVNNSRMQALDLVMRYLYFRSAYLHGNFPGVYRGRIENDLDDYTGVLNKEGISAEDIEDFKKAMRLSTYLFGKNAFRKLNSINSNRRTPINQLLFTVFAVLLSVTDENAVMTNYAEGCLTQKLFYAIESNPNLSRALSHGTNSRTSVETAFGAVQEKILNKLFPK